MSKTRLYELQVKDFWIRNGQFQLENYYKNLKELKLAKKELLEQCDKEDLRVLIWERTGEVL